MMKRRDFIRCGAAAAGGACLGWRWLPEPLHARSTPRHAQDVITLGRTGIRVSRLAQGTGTHGCNKSSNQLRKLDGCGLADLLVAGVDNGLSFWDLADQYGSHPHARMALQTVRSDRMVILTKTSASTEADMRAGLDRYRQEIGSDHIDIVLLNAMRHSNWPQEKAGAMVKDGCAIGSTPRCSSRWRRTRSTGSRSAPRRPRRCRIC
jgi:hypothetical protein